MRNRWIITLMYIVIVSLSLFVAFKASDFSDISEGDRIVLEGESFSPSFVAHNYTSGGLRHERYSIDIPGTMFDKTELDYSLIISRLADQAHKVYFNDRLIGYRGDYAKGQSNLWNGLSTYIISQQLIKENNTLTIETSASYRSGLSTEPIYIAPVDDVQQSIGRLDFYGEKVNTFSVGFIIFSSVITLLFYAIASKKDVTYLYISIATALTGLYYSDYSTYESLFMPYFTYKKLIMASLFIGVAFYSYIISRYFKKRWLSNLGHFTLVGTLIMVLFSPDMVVFKQLYTYWYIVLMLNVLSWVGISLKYIKQRLVAYIFFVSFLTIAAYGGVTVAMDVLGGYFKFNSPIVYITIFAVVPLLLIYEAIQEQNMLLVRERSLREQEFINSVTDNLTGIWNQRYMSIMFKEHIGAYTMAIIDVDDFKRINDNYGHSAGDYMLVTIASIITECLRKTDTVCRYGGDEFVVIMKNCKQEEGYKILEEVRLKIAGYDFNYKGKSIHGTISVGMIEENENHTLEYVFNQVDQLLYKAKADGKNVIAK